MAKKLMTNDVSRKLAGTIYASYAKGVPFRALEEKFDLLDCNGMTAFRIVRRYRKFLQLRRNRKPMEAAVGAGFAR